MTNRKRKRPLMVHRKEFDPEILLISAVVQSYWDQAQFFLYKYNKFWKSKPSMDTIERIRESIIWLREILVEDGGFEFWCRLGEIEPGVVRTNIRRDLGMTIEEAIDKLKSLHRKLLSEIKLPDD